MKNLFPFLFFFISIATNAQIGFGVKAGLNYSDNGQIEYHDVNVVGDDISQGAERKSGFHVGAFLKVQLPVKLYFQPEIMYTQLKSSFVINNSEADYNVKKIDVPLLVGYNVIGPLQVFAGPSLQYLTDHDLEGVRLGEIENEFTVGLQVGVGVEFAGFGVDVRYERALSANEAEALDFAETGAVERIDLRPDQFIVSLSFQL